MVLNDYGVSAIRSPIPGSALTWKVLEYRGRYRKCFENQICLEILNTHFLNEL